jgi:hypothetical protein
VNVLKREVDELKDKMRFADQDHGVTKSQLSAAQEQMVRFCLATHNLLLCIICPYLRRKEASRTHQCAKLLRTCIETRLPASLFFVRLRSTPRQFESRAKAARLVI